MAKMWSATLNLRSDLQAISRTAQAFALNISSYCTSEHLSWLCTISMCLSMLWMARWSMSSS
jgi:hypothetical protein